MNLQLAVGIIIWLFGVAFGVTVGVGIYEWRKAVRGWRRRKESR